MNTLAWKRLIGNIYPTSFKVFKTRKIILIYHAVGNSPWAIPPAVFKEQIQWLKSHCKIVPLTQLLTDNGNQNTIEVALTFDDGYSCLYNKVLPILQDSDATATVYINTGWMGDCEKSRKNSHPNLGHYPDETFLIWDEVKSLAKNGWEIGSHGVDHIDLTAQPSESIKKELENSKIDIERKLQKPCVHFAYTWGKHNVLVQNEVRAAKYQFSVAAQHGIITQQDDLLVLPRMNIAREYTIKDFSAVITGRWDYLNYIHQIKKKLKIGAYA
ncbi:MAG: polysaccharide deacetylase family protein [Gammaproteobacteria bacterium]|nr:polysaccharide deacetylase family protein [Gammaproteobacteria bacterium]